MTAPRTHCPCCGWPLREPTGQPPSIHSTSLGEVGYRQCVCGAWLVLLDGHLHAMPTTGRQPD